MNPIELIVPKIRTSAEVLKLHHIFGQDADVIAGMISKRNADKTFTVHIESLINSNQDGTEHVFTIEILRYDDPATEIDKTKNRSPKPASEQTLIDAYNTGIDLLNELSQSFEDDFDIQRENCFPFTKSKNCCTGYVFRVRFLTMSDMCY